MQQADAPRPAVIANNKERFDVDEFDITRSHIKII
jgi:hypothetical protein